MTRLRVRQSPAPPLRSRRLQLRVAASAIAKMRSRRRCSSIVRQSYRLEHGAEKLFDDLAQFVADERQAVANSSPYYAALRYADDELPHILNYMRHGGIELDNNLAENCFRPFALGRRNWMFMCTEDGAQASANIYSLLITAKANIDHSSQGKPISSS